MTGLRKFEATKGTVLILSTYPIVEPRHGGQVRLQNIKKAYLGAGWRVVSIAVYAEEAYSGSNVGADDVLFPMDSRYRLFNGRSVPLIVDLLTGLFAASEDGGLPTIMQRIPERIDVIHLEQPWLWPLVAVLRQLPQYFNAVFIYGSQNIETPLKQSILDAYGITSTQDVLERIDYTERQAALEADLCVAVTEDEVDVHRRWGAKETHLLPNGIEPWVADPDELAKWSQRLPRFPWLLYVASAHPPNFSHFSEIFGGSLGCLPPTSKLVVAGSVAEHIYSAMSKTTWGAINLSRLELLFQLSDRELAAVKTLAHGFVLPIPFGGGSNIKTAEALYSGAYVVGTTAAYRGFEQFTALPEVRVAANARDFQKAVRDVIALPKRSKSDATPGELELREALRWDVCLSRLPEFVEKISRLRGSCASSLA